MKLAKYLKPYWFLAVISPLLMIGEVFIDLLQPSLMSKIVDEGVLGSNMTIVLETGIRMLVLVIIGGAFGTLCAFTATKAAQSFGHDLRCAAFKKVMSLSIEQTDKFTTGSLVTRLTNDVSMVEDMVSMLLRMVIRSPIFFVGGTIMILSLDLTFGVVVLCALPLLVVALVVVLVKATPLFGMVQSRLDKVNSVVQENVSGARVIKAYVREKHENERFDKANSELKETNYKVLRLLSILMPVMMIFMNVAILAIFLIGGFRADAQEMLPGEIMAATTYITMILASMLMVGMMFQSISRASASAKRIIAVLDEAPVIVSGSENDADGIGKSSQTAIELKNVSFKYPGAADRPVLKGINIKIKRGETVAIIGATGSGKTSLVNLIPRFYDATEGEVLVDGINVRKYSTDALRKKIGFVMQKSELFSDTVNNNIRWGKPDATDAEIKAAVEVAQAEEFISGFTEGGETYIAEKGASLSGGQKQRVSIARALVRQPEILILDDSTSALDLATESKLQKALRERMKGTTVIMIAQRIASVINADRIAVIERGRVTATGTHKELLATSETYRDIYNSQMGNGGAANE